MRKPEDIASTIVALAAEKGVSVNKLATESGAGKSIVDNLKKGREPRALNLKLVADYLETTVDRLLLEEDTVVDRILSLMEKKGIKGTHLAEEIGLSKNAVSEWKSGKMKPSASAIAKIAVYFGVSTDYLLMPTRERELLEKGIADYFNTLDPAGLGSEAILTRINALTKSKFTLEQIKHIRNGERRPSHKEFWRMLNVFDEISSDIPPACHQLLGLLFDLDKRQEKSDAEIVGTAFDVALDEMSAASEKPTRK